MLQLSKKFRQYSPHHNRLLSLFLFTAVVVSGVGCGQKQAEQTKTPPPAVTVFKIEAQGIGTFREFVARTVAIKEVDLIARIEGELLERHFKEGSLVEKDQVLLKIDPAAYNASLASAKADLSSKLAGADGAKRDLARGKKVAKEGYISQSDLDKLMTNNSQMQAAVNVARSNVEQAELSLGYTVIKAPFTGRIGKVNFNVGNVIGPNSATLATLTAMDPMYVSFQVSESDFVTYLQSHQGEKNAKDIPIDITVRLPNNTVYGEQGQLIFADTKIQQGMGTVELRAVFNNPDGIILPGLFVNLMMEGRDKEQRSLVPQAAVQENQQGKFVLVVDDTNKVSQRLVVLGRRINAMWVVEQGLETDEKVIVEGLQKVRNGIEVKPVESAVDPVTGVITQTAAK